jgi:hypothetical protein
MIGRRSSMGLALLCAFAFCAFATQSAMAQVGTHSTNTTAVTCVSDPDNGDFDDAHCDKLAAGGPGTGDYSHVEIALDTTTEVEVSTAKTKNNTTEHTPAKLNGTLAGVNTEITCTTVKSVPNKSFLHNVEVSGKHTVTGTLEVEFTDCTVVKPLKCVIAEPIKTAATAQGVEGLNGKNEMGVEFVGSGAEKTFAEIKFENKGAEACSLLNGGKAFKVKGSVIATSGVAQGNDHSGATAIYEDANEMETLEIGAKKASFAGVFTTTMAGVGGNPIALTTTT